MDTMDKIEQTANTVGAVVGALTAVAGLVIIGSFVVAIVKPEKKKTK